MRVLAGINRNGLGAIAAVVSTFFFSSNDAAIKFLSSDFSLPQLMFLRSIVAIFVILAVIVPLTGQKVRLRGTNSAVLILRGVLMVLANLFFFIGLSVLPLADTVGVFFVCPLFIMLLSVVFLNEQIGKRRWIAVVVGMLGVIIMLRPGNAGFQVALLLPILAAVCYAILQVMTRAIGDHATATTMALYLQMAFFSFMGLMGLTFGAGQWSGQGGVLFEFLFRPWIWPAADSLHLLIFIGAATAGSNFFVSQAYRLGEASLIAPLEYVALPLGVIFGVLIFGEWPSLNSWSGMALIVGAGLFVVWRENLSDKNQDWVTTPRQ